MGEEARVWGGGCKRVSETERFVQMWCSCGVPGGGGGGVERKHTKMHDYSMRCKLVWGEEDGSGKVKW